MIRSPNDGLIRRYPSIGYLICKKKSFKVFINQTLLNEVSNLVDKPNVLIAQFDKNYLKLPQEVIRSTLQTHQRYFTLVDHRDRISNEFVETLGKTRIK